MNNFIPLTDYILFDFTKNNTEIVKRIKEYSIRNCRKHIKTQYITNTLNNFNYGYVYYRTEIINNINKSRPCAFVCFSFVDNKTIHIDLICSIKTNDKLGSNLLNKVFKYANDNYYNKITLNCDISNIEFYKKYGFITENNKNNNNILMVKIID